ncbi:TraR/DksA family transcriptional regulator [Alcaligenes sp.]|uniref:TraR/DksA family transcriptional regulator n=1 Tax=Alcaligenes sp. TaxID=512 RepID=UPI003D014B6A
MQEHIIRAELLKRLAEIQASIEHITSTSGIVELDQTVNGRLTRMDAMQQAAMESARLSRLENDNRKYLAALARLDNGDYGICCRCGDEIATERLHHDPATPFCRDCVDGSQSQK